MQSSAHTCTENGRCYGTAVEARYVYLYGVSPNYPGLARIGRTPYELIKTERLAAWVEWVSAKDFSPSTVEEKLRSIEWVGPAAREHERVLELAMHAGPIFPAPLCTLFTGVEALLGFLAMNETRFLSAFEKLAGRREWGLKLYCDDARVRSAVAAEEGQERATSGAVPPGHAYVLAKRREFQLAGRAAALSDQIVKKVIDTLAPLAFETRVKPCLAQHLTRRPETMVLNLAALVDKSAEATFHAEIVYLAAQIGADGFSFNLSGPWPPYSFCDGSDYGGMLETR
jgi:hypothetical protein